MSYHSRKLKAIRDILEKNVFPPVFNEQRWAFVKSVNCYAYALDIPINDPRGKIWIPGCINEERKNLNIFSTTELLDRLYNDLSFLNIKFKKNIDKLEKDEYRIAIYTFPSFYAWPIEFHFSRQDRNKIWSEKPSWDKNITKINHKGSIPLSMKKDNATLVETIILKK